MGGASQTRVPRMKAMENETVLVVDDEVEMLTLLRNYLTREGYVVQTAPSAEIALHMLEEHDFDMVLTDLRMRGLDGLALVRELHATRPETQVILMTGFGGIDTAVEAIKAGAYHFVAKPVKLPEVGALVRKALAERELRRENRQLRQAVEERYTFGQLLGKSAVMQRLFALLERLAATSSTVLIQGESGTGKEFVARALHFHGPRQRHPFVPVHCAAMPEGLLESELFGHTKGAFTGAQLARRGLFLEATRGTIFLDEIGEMPLGMQAKLLRVLEQRQIRPVGSDREVGVDVRVLAATNQDLSASGRNLCATPCRRQQAGATALHPRGIAPSEAAYVAGERARTVARHRASGHLERGGVGRRGRPEPGRPAAASMA